MARLFVEDKFAACHGSFNVRSDTYRVRAYVEGSIENTFVRGVDTKHLRTVLSSVTTSLENRYLDDIVGRATNENIGLYILYHLIPNSVSVVRVAGDGHCVEVFQSDVHPSFPSRLQYERARSLLYRNKIDESIDVVSESISLDQAFAPAYNLRGRCNRMKMQWDISLPDFETAVKLDPNFGEAYRNLGNALLYLGRIDEMIAAFSMAIEIMPQSALAVNNRGFAYQQLKELELALRDHTLAIEIDSNYAEAHSDMASVLQQLGRTEEATEHLKLAQELRESGKDTYATKPFY